MLFNFTLRALEDIQPWGKPDNKSLSWFGLTDGCYWLQVGECALFEYSEGLRDADGAGRYCEYQVVRLYEDMMEMAPYILEPVPESLIPYISLESSSAWGETRASWIDKHSESINDDLDGNILEAADALSYGRYLDSAYLSPSANIRMWSDEVGVHIEWDNRQKEIDGVPAWTAQFGSYQIHRSEFIEELQSFHARLMEEMRVRVESVLAGALPKDIRIDLVGLAREHAQRSMPIDRLMKGLPEPTDWNRIHKAIEQIKRG